MNPEFNAKEVAKIFQNASTRALFQFDSEKALKALKELKKEDEDSEQDREDDMER